jgi:hypothetical protein
MRGIQMNSMLRRAAAAGGVGALLMTVACGATQGGAALRAQEVAGAPAATPVVVSCEPNQRALVRPSVVNGVAMSQVECVSVGQPAAYAQDMVAAPAAPIYRASAPRLVQRAPDAGYADTQVIPAASYPATTARPVRAQQIVYDDRPVRTVKTRSVKKSAIIIGSSAGAGAGVGAAIGGKKGALIGAAIGGGGAALWDQITRRKN